VDEEEEVDVLAELASLLLLSAAVTGDCGCWEPDWGESPDSTGGSPAVAGFSQGCSLSAVSSAGRRMTYSCTTIGGEAGGVGAWVKAWVGVYCARRWGRRWAPRHGVWCAAPAGQGRAGCSSMQHSTTAQRQWEDATQRTSASCCRSALPPLSNQASTAVV